MGYDDEFGQCRQCGYDLLGLPDVGRCPECGRRYDRHSGKGLRLKRRSAEDVDQLLGRVRTISLAVAAVLILVCSGVLANAKGKSRILWVGAFVTLVTALAAWTSHLYERDDEDED